MKEIDLSDLAPEPQSIAETSIFVDILTPEMLKAVEESGEKMIFWYIGSDNEIREKGPDRFLKDHGLWSSSYLGIYFSLEPMTLEEFKAHIIDILDAPEGPWFALAGHRTTKQSAYILQHDSRRYNCIYPVQKAHPEILGGEKACV